ncbi:MAG: hypothetical protein V6D39_03240 [Dolichospermum lemmermannii FEM_B0920]
MKQLFSILIGAILFTPIQLLAQDITPVNEKSPQQINLIPLVGTEQVQLNLVNCQWFVDCKLAQLLLPKSAFMDKWELQFDNPNQTPVNVLNAKIVIKGSQTNYQLTSPTIQLPQEKQSLAANQIVDLPLTWNRGSIPPDNYTGAIYLTLTQQNNRFTIPVNLNVRSGPFIPLLVIVFGIILGRLFKYMQEKGKPQSELLETINDLELDTKKTFVEDKDKKLLISMLKKARQKVYQGNIEKAESIINDIEAHFELLTELQTIKDAFKGKEQVDAVKTAISKIEKAKDNIALNKNEEAKKIIEDLKQNPPQLTNMMSSHPSGKEEEIKKSSEKAINAINRLTEAKEIGDIEANNWVKFQSFLINLSGVSDQVRAEATFWIVQPLFALILLFGLSAVGIHSLYIENGKTFGANPSSDYLGLILWGLSSDVASRSLSNLKGDKENN